MVSAAFHAIDSSIHSNLPDDDVPGDVVFAVGTLCLALFAWRLLAGGKAVEAEVLPALRLSRAAK